MPFWFNIEIRGLNLRHFGILQVRLDDVMVPIDIQLYESLERLISNMLEQFSVNKTVWTEAHTRNQCF